jgi:NhaP-type Na+/H+ or K+/H+ antiporter
MDNAAAVLIVTGTFAVYALVAARLERLWITAPMAFVAAGWALGPHASGALTFAELDNQTILTVTELTLALLLFADASTVRLAQAEHDARLPSRLLFVGLPLTMALGALIARALFPAIGWAGAALLASILGPTDAALGMAVVTDQAVPVRVRRMLNIESGLNDGIATPFVVLFATILASEEGVEKGGWLLHATEEIGLAVLAAVVVGVAGGTLLSLARRRNWTSPVSEELAVLALAMCSYAGSVAIGGNGFIAAFVAGILFGAVTGRALHRATEFTETLSMYASFFVWFVFGALFVGTVISGPISLTAIAYAVLSLTVIRMAPVATALAGTGLRRETVAFAGWFGPRGLASVVFTLITIETLHGSAVANTLADVATWTILLSVVAHGITAPPLAAAYGRHASTWPPNAPELQSSAEPRVRRRGLGRAARPSD